FDFYAAREHPALDPGTALTDRFVPDELGRVREGTLNMLCDDETSCEVELDYVLAVAPIECQANEDCAGGLFCDQPRGECVECVTGDDSCASGQRCELGRCLPVTSRGCASGAGGTPAPLASLLLLMLLARQRERGRRRRR